MPGTALWAFSVTLMAAVLISEAAERGVLSTAVMFLIAGYVLGNGLLRVAVLSPTDATVQALTQLTLFTVLFTEAMQTRVREIIALWRLPGRALLLGLPLTLALCTLLGRYVALLPWPHALLVGAVLSPTDPVFARAIVQSERVPYKVRALLNIESGLNDGLVLPVVLLAVGLAGGNQPAPSVLVEEVALGVVLGIAIPWLFLRLQTSRAFGTSPVYAPLSAVARETRSNGWPISGGTGYHSSTANGRRR